MLQYYLMNWAEMTWMSFCYSVVKTEKEYNLK